MKSTHSHHFKYRMLAAAAFLFIQSAGAENLTSAVAQRIVANANASTETSIFQMTEVYVNRLSTLNAIMAAPSLNLTQKKSALNAYIQYARSEIRNQTGGQGKLYNNLTSLTHSIEAAELTPAIIAINTYFSSTVQAVKFWSAL